MGAKRRKPSRWQFLYWKEGNGWDKHGNRIGMREKCYAGSLKQACDRMLAFIERQPHPINIDYEVRDNHHTGKGYDCVDLNTIEHPITEHIN